MTTSAPAAAASSSASSSGVKVHVVFDWPKEKNQVLSVEEKQTFGEFKAALAKAAGLDLKGYAFAAVAYRTLPRDLSSFDDSAQLRGKDMNIVDLTTIMALAPAHAKPVIKREKKEEKKDDKATADPKVAVYKQFNVKNAIAKFKSFDEAKNAKSRKHALEYIEMYAKDILKRSEITDLSAELFAEIIKQDGLNCPESQVLETALKWAKAEIKRQKLDDKVENNKVVLKNIYPHIRFPMMEIQELASQGQASGLLDQGQLVALFTYVGQRSVSKSASLDSSLKEFSAKPRKPRQPIGAFTWDETTKGNAITVSNEGKTIKQTYGNNQWNTIRSKEWVKSGKYKIKFRIDGDQASHWIFIGLVNRNFSRYNDTSSGYIGSDSNGWGFTPGGSYPYLYHGGSSRNYGTVYRQGDVVTMNLDMDAKTVGWMVNSTDYGVAYSNLPDEVAIAVTLYDTNDAVSITEGDK